MSRVNVLRKFSDCAEAFDDDVPVPASGSSNLKLMRTSGTCAVSWRVLLVDDDSPLTRLLSIRLSSEGYDVRCSNNPRTALVLIDAWMPHIVVSDLCMDEMDGISLFAAIRKQHPTMPVILMTAHGSIADAVRATRLGVGAFLAKPFDGRVLIEEVQRQLELLVPQRDATNQPAWRERILTNNPRMNAVLDRAKRVANSDASVLIVGPSGSGKELLSRALHDASARSNGPFIAVNCGAIPEALLESELFGHIKGAFTGAVRDSPGLFRSARGGTLFLDEIGEMPVSMQVKLLRVLQERRVRSVGASAETELDVRVIAATHRDLSAKIKDGEFREDLYYRLSVIKLEVPALCERREDIAVLAQSFLQQLAPRYARPINGFSADALRRLVNYDWPGNVRQLFNVVEQCVALADGPLITELLVIDALGLPFDVKLPTLAEARDQFERDYLVQVLRVAGGQVPIAAGLAGRNRTDFYRLLRKHGVEPDLFKTGASVANDAFLGK